MITTSFFRSKTETINNIISDRLDNGLLIKDLAIKYKLSERSISNFLFFYGVSRIKCNIKLKFIRLLKKNLKIHAIAHEIGYTNDHSIYIQIHKYCKSDPKFKKIYLAYKQRMKDEKKAVWNEIIERYKAGSKITSLAIQFSYSQERIHQIVRDYK